MLDALTWTVGVIGVAALLLNICALYIFISRPKQRLGSKYMIPTVVALNILQSICYTLSMPRVVVHNYCIAVVTSGPLSSGNAGSIVLATSSVNWHVILLTLVNSFFKKYIIFCR
ncbi:hypothetical protein Aduo_004024 [Ancylostoma duodenale]